MGQVNSITDNIIPDTYDSLQIQVVKHAKVFSEIGALTYEDFQQCLAELNELSRKCLDPKGKQLVFLVKKGTDTSLLWKATVKIACVKVDPSNRQIENYKFLNLKQFLCVFKTFQSHLATLVSSEEQMDQKEHQLRSEVTASILMDRVQSLTASSSTSNHSSPTNSQASTPDKLDECSICMDRKTEVILPCAHSFCVPCIEQWNVSNKTCPICSQELASTDDTWVMSEMPGVDEVSDKICAELMNLSKEVKKE